MFFCSFSSSGSKGDRRVNGVYKSYLYNLIIAVLHIHTPFLSEEFELRRALLFWFQAARKITISVPFIIHATPHFSTHTFQPLDTQASLCTNYRKSPRILLYLSQRYTSIIALHYFQKILKHSYFYHPISFF